METMEREDPNQALGTEAHQKAWSSEQHDPQ